MASDIKSQDCEKKKHHHVCPWSVDPHMELSSAAFAQWTPRTLAQVSHPTHKRNTDLVTSPQRAPLSWVL